MSDQQPRMNVADVESAMFMADCYKTLHRLTSPIDRVVVIDGEMIMFYSSEEPNNIVAVGPNGSFVSHGRYEMVIREELSQLKQLTEQGAMNLAYESLNERILKRSLEATESGDEDA